MDFRKCNSFSGSHPHPSGMGPAVLPTNGPEINGYEKKNSGRGAEDDVDVDLGEIYFLIMHFLSGGPCQRTFGHLQNELLEHQLLPRRYHAWFSRSGERTGHEEDDGISFPLNYCNLVERYPHVGKDHLVRLMKQLMLTVAPPLHSKIGIKAPSAADVPTLMGTGSFSLLNCHKAETKKPFKPLPPHLIWPHMRANQVRGLSLREIDGGFRKHHRAPSIHSACYAIAKPSMIIMRIQSFKTLRGHRVAVYCAIFDRSGRYVITGSDDRLVKIWSMETALCLASCRGHEGDITDLAISSNNTLVASASNDFVIRVWRLPDGVPISVLRGHTGAVTAIVFSPRPSSVYQLLSSSDDGTCRIWDARYSQCAPRIYLPKPPDGVAGRGNSLSASEPSSSINMQNHQILCCAYNANGTVFVTGSSDTFARVWSACKPTTEDPEQPIHEMDVLSGHENDVNYVQFSGCSVVPRSAISDTLREEHIAKFRNSWFSHDNIVTCSRDGSAIIWVPRSRKYHGKGVRWTRAYHLKVPPPPLPPQPPRGGPRQRILPTPRGVNMIVWSLDNRFVLAAIMDCRICVWNAADGSLVHSLTGHNESSYVLDVHPWNPRIAMSAGYDGKAIVWDIWEGTPIRVFDMGRVKLVDGKFNPDGTSIVLSDDYGRIHLLNTGQGDSQRYGKYDQFFLGDYRPLIRDALGNVLDQESQQPPHRRNFQDPLCDASLIPYPEPYQTMYQKRRLGVLGMEWHPPTTTFIVGMDFSMGQDYQVPPLADLERLMEPLPEFVDALYWEPDNEILTDDNDSEFNVADEYSSEGDRQSLSFDSYSDPECSAADSDDKRNHRDRQNRSGRNRRSPEVEWVSSGRQARKRNSDECEGSSTRVVRSKKPKNSQKGPMRKKSRENSIRPQRVAAKNALNMFSQYSGTSTGGENEDDTEYSSSDRDSAPPKLTSKRNESDQQLHIMQEEECQPAEFTESQSNVGNRKRLVLKLQLRKKPASSDDVRAEASAGYLISKDEAFHSGAATDVQIPNMKREGDASEGQEENASILQRECTVSNEKGDAIGWGDVKVGSSARVQLDSFPVKIRDAFNCSSSYHLENLNLVKRSEEPSEYDSLNKANVLRAGYSAPLEDACTYSSYEQHTLFGLSREGDPSPTHAIPTNRSTVFRIKTKGLPKLKLSSPGCSRGDTAEGDVKQKNQKIEISREGESTRGRLSSRNEQIESDPPETATDAIRRKRSMKMKATSMEPLRTSITFKTKRHEDRWTSKSVDLHRNMHDEHPMPSSRMKAILKSDKARMDDLHGNDHGIPRRSNPAESVAKPSWLMLSKQEESYRYIPQMGDEVIYLRQGHQEFIESSGSSDAGPWTSFKTLRAVEICEVVKLEYAASPGSGESCCKLTLRFVDQASSVFGKTYKLTLPELTGFPEFLIERTWYEKSLSINWTTGDECLVWWRDESEVGGSWWEGEIVFCRAKSEEFPDSPWEIYSVRYEDMNTYRHSPWELHKPDRSRDHRQIDDNSKNILLTCLGRLEKSISKNKDKYGIRRLNEVSQRSDFDNRFPVPIYPELIQLRLRNGYYRSTEAAKHDIAVMLTNAKSYFAAHYPDLLSNMKRLTDLFERAYSKL